MTTFSERERIAADHGYRFHEFYWRNAKGIGVHSLNDGGWFLSFPIGHPRHAEMTEYRTFTAALKAGNEA